MKPKTGDAFGSFGQAIDKDPFRLTPIRTEFSKGGVPDSITTANRESAWSRWRRGYELATANVYDNDFSYPFKYTIPVSSTTSGSVENPQPTVSGAFVGFPTKDKELGMHWAGWRYAGSLRCDKITDPVSLQKLFIESVTEDADYWYVKLAGTWSASNRLPPPFFVQIGGGPFGITPITTEILEDRVITQDGPIINADTINPATQKRYGYVQAVLVNTGSTTGILKFRKAGSVYVSPDKELLTPSPVGFTPGRFLITGARFCCSCQDFTRRDYAFTEIGGDTTKKVFPRTGIANIKPGRNEITTLSGTVDNSAMTSAKVNRRMTVYAPSGYPVSLGQGGSVQEGQNVNRDNPGVYRDFGAIYLRKTSTPAEPSLPGSAAESMPGYDDYSSANGKITAISDNWTPLLDEFRYCKHIYALKFKDGTFPPEPSDFPVGIGSMAAWEQKLVDQTESDQLESRAAMMTRKTLSKMDVPPYNCQSPMMMPMMQKLFNIPADLVVMENFVMIDKDGNEYVPSLDQKPAS
jgi:hypothetical protein